MEKSSKPNFCGSGEDDEKNRECIYGSLEAAEGNYRKFRYEIWPSSMNPGSQAAAGPSQPAVTGQQLGQPPHTAASVDSYPRRNDPPVLQLERKRENDRAYRKRIKEKEMIMKSNLSTVGDQNERLKHENESLRMDNFLVDQKLQSQSKELSQLKCELDTLNHEHKKQNELVQTLSDRLVCLSDLQNKNVELIRENLLLRQNSSLSLESIKLVEEHAALQLQNMILRAQKDALCGKLVRDGQLKKQSCMNNYEG